MAIVAKADDDGAARAHSDVGSGGPPAKRNSALITNVVAMPRAPGHDSGERLPPSCGPASAYARQRHAPRDHGRQTHDGSGEGEQPPGDEGDSQRQGGVRQGPWRLATSGEAPLPGVLAVFMQSPLK